MMVEELMMLFVETFKFTLNTINVKIEIWKRKKSYINISKQLAYIEI